MVDKILRAKEAAKILGINVGHLYNLLARGEVPGFKIPRIARAVTRGKPAGSWRIPQEPFETWLFLKSIEGMPQDVKDAMETIRRIRKIMDQEKERANPPLPPWVPPWMKKKDKAGDEI